MSARPSSGQLPAWVRLSPYALYWAAAFAFLCTLIFGLMEASAQGEYAVETGLEHALLRLQLRTVFEAVREAAYLASSGFMLHILIAIWASLQRREDLGGGE